MKQNILISFSIIIEIKIYKWDLLKHPHFRITKTAIFPSPRVSGFVDSIKVFKALYPGRQNYKLQSLLQEFCPQENLAAHEALDDAR